MAIENREKELKAIYQDIDEDKLVLPNFQRGFVWNREQQSKLLASVLVGLPVGSLLVLEGKAEDFSKRELCFPTELNIDKGCDYVLDGQQRLSTLRSIFYDLFEGEDWKESWSRMYGSLRTRWFVTIKPMKNEDDIFGYRTLNFDSLSKYTDSDLIDFIKSAPIRKTKADELHNPDYVVKNKDGNVEDRPAFIADHLSTKYAELDQVPLWEVGTNKGIHRKVLQKISQIRVSELQVEAESSGDSLKFYENVFSPIDTTRDDLELILNDETINGDVSDKLASKWAELKAGWVEKVSRELESMPTRKMAVIHLNRQEVNRAVAIFEAINRGGVPLSTYDLVVAKSARDQGVKNLSSKIRDLVESNELMSKDIFDRFGSDFPGVDALWSAKDMKVTVGNEPSNQLKDWFVNVLSLLVYVKKDSETCTVDHIKKEKILSLSCEQVNGNADKAMKGILRALAFVQLRCGVITSKDVSYKLMIVVLAYHLSSDEVWESKSAINKLEYWYWLSLFGGEYLYRQNEQCVEDIVNLGKFVAGKVNPFTGITGKILNVQDIVTKEILLRAGDMDEPEPRSIKQSLLQFVLSKGPSDFVKANATGTISKLYSWRIARGDVEVEIHHIIPLAEATTLGESSKTLRKDSSSVMNSSLNLAYISKAANRELSSSSPAEYLKVVHDIAAATNFLPGADAFTTVLLDKDYKGILEKRYNLLESGIKQHISSLI